MHILAGQQNSTPGVGMTTLVFVCLLPEKALNAVLSGVDLECSVSVSEFKRH